MLASGETISPEQVLGPARPSRSLALTGDTGPAASVVDAATGVDLLVHEATFGADERQRARETNHSTAAEAALTAKAAGVGLLALTHLSARYFGARGRRGGARRLPRHGRAARLRRDRDSVRRARRARPRSPWSATQPRAGHTSARGVSAGDTPDFGARARIYDTLRPTDAAWWEAFAAMVELGDLRGQRVLDVGCGTGRLLAALVSEAHAKAWGIDGSAEMVAVARETLPAGVGVRRGEAERLPFRDGWFDRVTMSLVLHLVDRPQALAEARRVVPDDGRIAISTFHPDHFETYWLQPFFPSIKAVDAARFPTPDEMERELAAAGFPHIEMRRLTADNELSREEALARIHGRHISTFDLLSPEEIEEGTARAERELPDRIVSRLDRLVVVGLVG